MREIKLVMLGGAGAAGLRSGLHGAGRVSLAGMPQPASTTAARMAFEILYAHASATANNGSAFAGLECQHALLQHHHGPGHAGRALSDACAHAGRGRQPGRLPGHRAQARALSPRPRRCSWACWCFVVLVVGGLTFLPALALGPVIEHL